MSIENKALTKACENYLNDTIQIPKELKNLRGFIAKDSNIDISISDTQVSYFETLLKIKNPSKILEIGTFYGYSTACLAMFSKETTEITTIDIDKKTLEKAIAQWEKLPNNISKKIKIIAGNALDELKHLISEKKKYDLIFIDADKNNYQNYFESSLNMLEENGIIILDNIFQEGNIFLSKNEIKKQFSEKDKRKYKRILLMKELVENIIKDKKLITSISPIGDGMLVIQIK